MPRAPFRAPRPAGSVDDVLAMLREGGGRVSAARRAVLTVLFGSSGPLSAEQVATQAVPPLNVPATYRNLDNLEAVGIVRHVHLGHGPGLYELVGEAECEYGLCERCGGAVVLDPAALDGVRDAIDEATGIRPHFTHFPLVGACVACRG